MNNRNFPPGPFPTYSPELLAQIAAAAFRPPPPMSAPPLPSAPHVRGMSVNDMLRLLNAGLGNGTSQQSGRGATLMQGIANAPGVYSPPPPPPPSPSLPTIDFLTGQWNPKGGFSA
jgi:hypothetical protein